MKTMKRTQRTRTAQALRWAALGAVMAGSLIVTGCGAGFLTSSNGPVPVAGSAMQGSVHGGQQPVSGAAIQLYAANLSGYGASSYALLTTTVTTNGSGFFNITGDYTCPSSSTPVYITASGGSAGSGTNAGIGMMTALGACGDLTPTTYISINELTTVASAYALSAFMSSPTQLSTSATNILGLTNAFATVNKLVNTGAGSIPGSTLPAGVTVPAAELNTLADILAACINSAGGSSCSSLFANAAPAGGTTPADTITAILDIAKNPGHNAGALYGSVSPTAPFQPTLALAPTDFTVALKYAAAGTFSAPSAGALDPKGNFWVTNAGNNTITVLNATTGVSSFTSGGSLNVPSGIAFEQGGGAWVTNKGNSTLSAFTGAGMGIVSPVTGLSSPTAIAVDGQNLLWITNAGNSSITEVAFTGTSATGFANYGTGTGGVSAPVAVAINPH